MNILPVSVNVKWIWLHWRCTAYHGTIAHNPIWMPLKMSRNYYDCVYLLNCLFVKPDGLYVTISIYWKHPVPGIHSHSHSPIHKAKDDDNIKGWLIVWLVEVNDWQWQYLSRRMLWTYRRHLEFITPLTQNREIGYICWRYLGNTYDCFCLEEFQKFGSILWVRCCLPLVSMINIDILALERVKLASLQVRASALSCRCCFASPIHPYRHPWVISVTSTCFWEPQHTDSDCSRLIGIPCAWAMKPKCRTT